MLQFQFRILRDAGKNLFLFPVSQISRNKSPCTDQYTENHHIPKGFHTTEEYRQALEILNQWYEEGIIDPECITDDRSAGKWPDRWIM